MHGRHPDEASRQFDLAMMRICLDLASDAAAQGEIPVGALVIQAGAIIATGHNLTERLADPTAHAERLVLTEAGRVRRSWRLDGCTLYATLEPCPMCAGAIVQSRLDRLVYGANDPKAGACRSLYRLLDDPRLNHQVEWTAGVLEKPCADILTRFFQDRRRTVSPLGGVPEWSKGPVSKTGGPVPGPVGSNPTSSAN